jgi:F0F1-type ATP synthase epsilon subunit
MGEKSEFKEEMMRHRRKHFEGWVKMLVKGGQLKVEEEKMTIMRYTVCCLCGKF